MSLGATITLPLAGAALPSKCASGSSALGPSADVPPVKYANEHHMIPRPPPSPSTTTNNNKNDDDDTAAASSSDVFLPCYAPYHMTSHHPTLRAAIICMLE